MSKIVNNIVTFIFARGGSKGLPQKNILDFNGQPLIAWAIKQALAVEQIEEVFVSTDNEQIAEIAEKYGATIPFFRPSNLAQDDTPEWSAWQHAITSIMRIRNIQPDMFISIPATSPLRKSEDIQACIDKYLATSADIVITATPAKRSPYFNMVKRLDSGAVELVNKLDKNIVRRQDCPEVFDIATVAYVANPQFILNNKSIFDGVVLPVIIPPERAIDIDSLQDFQIAQFLSLQKQ